MFKKTISLILSLSLIITQPIFAQGLSQLNLAQYLGQMHPSAIDSFRPTQLRYFSYDNPNNSYRILLDKGDLKDIKDNQLKEEAKELMDYFLIGLALPNDTFWVNLRPDSPDNIIDPELEKTDLGRILLEADLQLKKDTAGLTSPQAPEGKAYWDKLYKKAAELFGNENITIPTLTRPWIVPGEIIVRESQNSAYIYKATLKVMLEEDYLKSPSHKVTRSPNNQPLTSNYTFSDPRLKELNEYSTQIIRETIIPKIIREVNSSKKYAKLRQVYYSLVLSRWFKMRFSGKSGQYADLIDKHDLTNLTTQEPYNKLTYFKEYQESFAQGEYNLKEQVYTPYGQSVRSYMSGGFTAEYINFSGPEIKAETASNPAEEQLLALPGENTVILDNNLNIIDPKQPLTLAASEVTAKELRSAGTIASREKVLEAKNIIVKFFNSPKGKNEAYQKYINASVDNIGILLEAAKEAVRLMQGGSNRLFKDEILPFEAAYPDTFDLEKMAEIESFLEQLHKDSTASPLIVDDVVNILEKTNKDFDDLLYIATFSDNEKKSIISVYDSIEKELEIWDEFQPQQIFKKEEFRIILNNTIVKLESLKKSENATYRIHYILTPAIAELKKLQGMQQSSATAPPLTNEGEIINAEVLENISGSKKIIKLFSDDGKELIKRYPGSKELYEETENKLEIYWKTKETYDIQKAVEAALEFYAAFQSQGLKVEPEIENKIKILQDTGAIINGVVEKIKFSIENDIIELGKRVNTGVVSKDLNRFSRELSLKNSKATVNYILFLLSDQFKPYRGDIPESFIEDSTMKYFLIKTELEIFDFSPTASSAMAEGYVIDNEVRKKIENIKYALMMFSFKAREFTRYSKFKKELEELYQEANKKIMSAREANDIIGVSDALREFYAATAGFQFQESSVMPEVSEKLAELAELDKLKSIIDAVVGKVKNLMELDMTAFEEVILNKEDVDFTDIESIIKELNLNNLKPAALEMKDLFEEHHPKGYSEYARKWASIITELKIFDLPAASSALTPQEIKEQAIKELNNKKKSAKPFQVYRRLYGILYSLTPANRIDYYDNDLNKAYSREEVLRLLKNEILFLRKITEAKKGDRVVLDQEPLITIEAQRILGIFNGLLKGLNTAASSLQEFKIGGINSNESIDVLTELTGLTIEEIERRARPGAYSESGFISGSESFKEVLKKDNTFVLGKKLTHRKLAEPLLEAMGRLVFTYNGRQFWVQERSYLGYQDSIFNDGLRNKTDCIVTNMTTKKTIRFSELLPTYILNYGFYEGAVSYRLEPMAIIDFFGITASSGLTSEPQPSLPLGGIDFTDKAMRIGLEPMGSFADLKLVLPEVANVAALDLDAEFKQIQVMASSGIRPADNRILEFAAACYYRGEFSSRLGEITACLQQAHFLDERLGKESSPALRLATMLPEVLYSHSLN